MQILFHDNYLLAINKPAGLSSESGAAPHPSAEREALHYLGDHLNAATATHARRVPYLRVAHRLDRPASGVLLLAKTKTALTGLMAQFEQRSVEKIYWAEATASPPAASGTLTHYLKRSPDGKSALVFDEPVPDARAATLQYRVLENTGTSVRLEIRPASGRFHQIRAQLAHAGCPIVGDERYGGPPWREHAIKLHARQLSIRHPKSGEILVLEAELPADW